MRKIIVLEFLTLDGVMQAPGGPEEDPTEHFEYGGWQAPILDDVFGQEMAKQMGQPFDLLLGKKTYDIFAEYWPKHDNEVGKPLNSATKYVVTNEKIDNVWDKTVQIKDDVVAELKKLKDSDGPMLQVYGSGKMVQTLLKNDLVDELWLKIHPLTLGQGKKLFAEGTMPAAFKLTYTKVTPNGIIFANYKRAGEVKTGTIGD